MYRRWLVQNPLAADVDAVAVPVRPVDGGVQSAGAAISVQCDFSDLRSRAKMAAGIEYGTLSGAVSVGSFVSGRGVPAGANHFQPRLFCRSGRLGDRRPVVAGLDVCADPAGSDGDASAVMAGRRAVLVRCAGRTPPHAGDGGAGRCQSGGASGASAPVPDRQNCHFRL